jgi:hypothetical protein
MITVFPRAVCALGHASGRWRPGLPGSAGASAGSDRRLPGPTEEEVRRLPGTLQGVYRLIASPPCGAGLRRCYTTRAPS